MRNRKMKRGRNGCGIGLAAALLLYASAHAQEVTATAAAEAPAEASAGDGGAGSSLRGWLSRITDTIGSSAGAAPSETEDATAAAVDVVPAQPDPPLPSLTTLGIDPAETPASTIDAAAPMATGAVPQPEASSAEAVNASDAATEQPVSGRGWWHRILGGAAEPPATTTDAAPAESAITAHPEQGQATDAGVSMPVVPAAPAVAATTNDTPASPSASPAPQTPAAPASANAETASPATREAALPPAATVLPTIAAGSPNWADGGFIRSLQNGDTLVLLPGVQGVTADTYEPLGIDEAVALALHNNYAGTASAATKSAAYWEKLASYSLYGPTAEYRYAEGSETSSPASYNDSSGNRVATDTHHRRDKMLSIRQPIVDVSVVADMLLKREREHYAVETDRDTREGIAYDTLNAYLGLMQSSMAVKLAENYRTYLQQLAERMKARVDGGGATAGDWDRIQGRMTNAESARIQAEGEYQNSLAEFKRLTHVLPSRLAIPEIIAPAIPAAADAAIEQAVRENASYRGMLSKIDMARRARDHSYAGLLPTVNMEYEHSYTYNAGGAAKGNPVDGAYPTQDDKRLMLVAHWAITGGYNILNGVAGEKHVREAHFQAMDTKERLEQAVQSSYNAVASANARIEAMKKGVDANTRVVTEFEDQQKNGRRSLFELLDAYEQLYNSKMSLMRMVVSRAQAGYLVHRQMGTLLPTLQAASESAKTETVSEKE